MLFNANNLFKTSMGTIGDFGGITYVLNTRALQDRSFWEVWDGGVLEGTYTQLLGGKYPGLGTVHPPAFYHLLQPHEELWTKASKSYGSIAELFNRWWVPGTPLPPGFGHGPGTLATSVVLSFLLALPFCTRALESPVWMIACLQATEQIDRTAIV